MSARSRRDPKPPEQLTRTERRERQRRRRARVGVLCTVAACALVLAAWFPVAALEHQRHEVDAAAAELRQTKQETKALSAEKARLSSPSEVERIAREKYQLVSPGQQAYTVLPPNGTAEGQYSGDPGYQKPVSPNAASDLPPGETTTTSPPATSKSSSGDAGSSTPGAGSSTAGRATTSGDPGTLLSRIESSLEFWR